LEDKKTLEELFECNMDKIYTETDEKLEINKQISELTDKLNKTLSEEQKQLLEEINQKEDEKRDIINKNTVTILGVILGIVVLYFGYNWRVNSAVEEVEIPYAKKTLTATSPITQDAIGRTKVLKSFVSNSKNVIQNQANIIKTLKHELSNVWLYEYGHNQEEKEFNCEDICEIVASSNDFINEIVERYTENQKTLLYADDKFVGEVINEH